MSKVLRNKLFEELEKKATKRLSTYTKLKNVGAFFDEGTTIITKENFMNEISNWRDRSISNVQYNLTTEEAFEVSLYNGEWVDRGKEIYKRMEKLSQGGKEKWRLHRPKGVSKSLGWNINEIVFHYTRKTEGTKYNLESAFNTRLKKVVKEVIANKKIHIDYSHGKTLPKDFKNTEPTLAPGTKKRFHGSAGTLSHRKVEGALTKIFKAYTGPNDDMFVTVARLFEAKFEDMFDTQLILEGKRSKKADSSTIRYRGQLVFTKDGKNPSAPDKEVLDHFKDFIGRDPEGAMTDVFAEEVMRLCKVDLNKAQDLWSASPGPLDRANIMKQALIAEGLMTVKGKLDKRSKRVGKGGGLDMRMKVNQEFIRKMNGLKASSGTSKGRSPRKMKKMVTSTVGTIARKKVRVRTKDAAKTAQSPLHLEAMLQALLPQVVASKMGQGGALRYQTGRFADSVKPEAVMVGPQGGVQVDYTYMKFPYQTFEPGFKQGSTQRDPRKIIGESVREIAQSIIGNKFLKVRRV